MRILILSASVGSGHMRAADAVRRALGECDPGGEARVVDALELAPTAFRKAYDGGYFGLVRNAPHLVGYLYDALDRPNKGDRFRRFVETWAMRRLSQLIEEGGWDAVVHTHFLTAQTFSLLRRSGRSLLPHVVAVTDFEAHRLWANPPCERYFTATDDGSAALAGWGVRPSSIMVTGIPIDPAFLRLPSQPAARKALLLEPDGPVVLQLAGGSGIGPVREILEKLLALPEPVQIVTVAGRNEQLRVELSAISPGRHRLRVLGFTSRVPELMAAADLIVTKPGGLTTSEALAAGAPIVAVDPIPGQESRNCDHLLEKGAGVKVNSLSALTGKVAALLEDRPRLGAMRRRAKAAGRPLAAYEVARVALELARKARLDPALAWAGYGNAPEPREAGRGPTEFGAPLCLSTGFDR